jgi:chemosensory pili system protein ChpA (sensor histidine kinase/response regulator)
MEVPDVAAPVPVIGTPGGAGGKPFATRAEPAPAVVSAIEAPAPALTAAEIEERRELQEAEEKQWPEKMERRGQVRVNTSLLNELVNYAGEVSISRSRMEQQIYSVRDNLSELSRNITRFREQIRELEIQSESQILYRMEHEAVAEGRAADFDPLSSTLQPHAAVVAVANGKLARPGDHPEQPGNFVGEANRCCSNRRASTPTCKKV